MKIVKVGLMSIGIWSDFISPYTSSSVRQFVPRRPGVFVLWEKQTSQAWTCFLVGKADDLEARLQTFLKGAEPDAYIRGMVKNECGFHFMEILDPNERSNAEKYLFDFLKPLLNLVDPGGLRTPIALPVVPC